MKEMDVVCGVIICDGKVCIAQRKSKERDGIWEFVGGKVEKKETKEQAIVREVYEELSLKTCIIRHLCTFYDEREEVRICIDAFLMRFVSGELKLHAHYEARWIGVEELDDYKFEEADQPLLEIVKAL